jgi:hypothetical protein
MTNRSKDSAGGRSDNLVERWVTGQPSGNKTLVSGDTANTLGIQAHFLRPGTYTAYFTFEPLDSLTAPPTIAPVRIEATIEWMVGGNTVTRRVSIVNGTSIQGVCESVRIVVRDVTVPVGATVTLGIRYNVSVSVAPGARGSYETPPILCESTSISILAGNVFVGAIPQNVGAKSILVMVAAPSGVPIAEQACQVAQVNSAFVPLGQYDPRAFAWAPVLPGASNFQLFNNSPVTLLFAVVFGIDG